ncbi:MAG TPA: FHA domain-containing protein [Bryobacteraceae bacterium]
MAQTGQHPNNASEARLNGNVIIGELLRNMELGRFDMAYSVLLPCVFTVYLNPEDHAALSGVFDLVVEDACRALRARVAELNAKPALLSLSRRGKTTKEHKIAGRDWDIEFLPDIEVPVGDVEIHSELNESVQPGYRGTKTTLISREPSATAQRAGQTTTGQMKISHNTESGRADTVYAEVRYQDDSGPQVYLIVQNRVRIGRGGNEQPMDLALYTNDEVSREHLVIRRDPATGAFFVSDSSTNGTWVNGKRLRKSAEEPLPEHAEIGVGEILTLQFEVRK